MKSISLYLIRYLGVLLKFLITYLILKKLSVENYGLYSVIINLLNWQVVIADLGFSKHSLKLYCKEEEINLNTVLPRILPQFIILGILSTIILVFHELVGIEISIYLILISILTLVYTFFSKALQGIKTQDFTTIFFESAFYPLILLLLLILQISYINNPKEILILMLVGRVSTLIIITIYLLRKKIAVVSNGLFKNIKERALILIQESKYLYLIELSSKAIILIPILFYGFFLSNEEIAVLGFAEKIGLISTTFLSALNFILAPKFRRHYNNQNIKGIKTLYIRSTKFLALSMIPAFIMLSLILTKLISVINADYIKWLPTFNIYLLAHLVNVLFGSVGWILIMTDNEKTVTRNNMFSIIIFLLFFGILDKTPTYAALNFLILVTIQNISNFYKVRSIIYEK